jgi:hypothetical protein
MSKNYNIQTVSGHLGGVGVGGAGNNLAIGPVVPAGMTRYVTFLKVTPMNPHNVEGALVQFCSGTVAEAFSDAEASGAEKMAIRIASTSTLSNKEVVVPSSPDTEHPLFTVASAAYLRAHLASLATMSSSVAIFVQYFDE